MVRCMKSKNEGRLSIRDLRLVNLAFLRKWHRRLIVGGEALWKDITGARYENGYQWDHRGGRVVDLRGV
jgi:hypothetical protein